LPEVLVPSFNQYFGQKETPTVSGVGHHLTGDRHPGDTAGVLLCPERAFGPKEGGAADSFRDRQGRNSPVADGNPAVPPGACVRDPSVADN
jgi:hypothetical protein